MALTRVIRAEDLAAIVADVGLTPLVDDMITRLVAALERHDPEMLLTVDRSGFHYGKPDVGLVEWMPAMDLGRRVSIKVVAYHPTNPVERNIPTIFASTSIYDTVTGRLVALCEASFLTALRTGAASAIATDVLAVPGPIVLGVVGCGAQAVTQVHAISRVRDIERVLAFDVDEQVAASLAARIPIDDLEVVMVDGEAGLHLLAGSSDVICTATSVASGDDPVLPDVEFRPGLHINAVGADFAGKCELSLATLQRAVVCPDVASQCLAEGESQRLGAADLGPDLVRLVAERGRFERHRADLTVFDSTGWALEDLVAAELLLDHADRCGVGLELELHRIPRDPYDPYEVVR